MATRKTAAPRGVLRPTGSAERFEHARYHPSADLAGYIEHFWSVRWHLDGLPPERVETLPHPSIHLLFENGVGVFGGLSRGKFSRLLEGDGGVLGVKFLPGAFAPFMRKPLSSLASSRVRLRAVWGAAADVLERDVHAADDDAAKIERVETFLRERLPAADAKSVLATRIAETMASDRTILRVDDVALRFAIDTRALQRLFARYVGMNPKWVIQRYRLHEAAAQLAADPDASQAALALGLGYSDQAHFVRDFKSIVGTSPAAYAQARSSAQSARG